MKRYNVKGYHIANVKKLLVYTLTFVVCIALATGCSKVGEMSSNQERGSADTNEPLPVQTLEPSPIPTSAPTAEPVITDVQKAYEQAIDIDFSDLKVNSIGSYYYDDINIPASLVEGRFGSKLSQATIYTSIAKQLDGFYLFGEVVERTGTRALYPNWGKDLVPLVFGFEKLSYEEMLPYIENASTFIDQTYPIGELLSKFQNLSVCDGTFDYSSGKCDFTIDDLSLAAKDLGITEDMLGYIFAWLDVYGTETVFNGNSCSCSFIYHANIDMRDSDFSYTFGYSLGENEPVDFLNDRSDDLVCFVYDTVNGAVPDDSMNNFSTDRGIQLLHTKNAVILSYGVTEDRPYDPKNDELQAMAHKENTALSILADSCSDYMVYSYEDKGQLAFYFDKDSRVICVMYIRGHLYEDSIESNISDTGSIERTVTVGEDNAVASAQAYLKTMPFSYTSLVEQLEYEGYTHDETIYGVDNCGADWNEQAAKSAKAYLETMSFSKDGLIEQLEYEGFTHEQAVYGVEQNGY